MRIIDNFVGGESKKSQEFYTVLPQQGFVLPSLGTYAIISKIRNVLGETEMTDAQIFQLFGIMYLAVGFGILINPEFYKKMLADFGQSRPMIYFGGLSVLAVGYLLVMFHNVWVRDWPVIITVIGWGAFLKGVFLLMLPKMSMRVCDILKDMGKLLIVWAIVALILGGLCCWLGFFVL